MLGCMMEPRRIKESFLTFIECTFDGGWQDIQEIGLITVTESPGTTYRAWQEPAYIYLVRADGLRRNLSFRNEAQVIIHPGMIHFKNDDFLEEVRIDENEQAGKEGKTKLAL